MEILCTQIYQDKDNNERGFHTEYVIIIDVYTYIWYIEYRDNVYRLLNL